MSNDLKPCPFCGCEAAWTMQKDFVRCSNTSCFMIMNAIAPLNWNKRPASDNQQPGECSLYDIFVVKGGFMEKFNPEIVATASSFEEAIRIVDEFKKRFGTVYHTKRVPVREALALSEADHTEAVRLLVDGAQAKGYDGKGMSSALTALLKRFDLRRKPNV